MKNVIYKIRNVVNNKFYVGSTVDARIRFQAHKRKLRTGKHQSPHMQAAWNKYGEDCFKFEVVEQVDCSEKLLIAEQVWLDEHAGKPYCYNWAKDASAPMRGKKHSKESIIKCAAAGAKCPKGVDSVLYGIPRSAETKAKISEKCKGLPNKMKGLKLSEQGRANISAAVKRGEDSFWYGKRPPVADMSQKEIIAVLPDQTTRRFISLSNMRDTLGVSVATIIRACKSGQPIRQDVCAGWVLSYADGEQNKAPEIPEEFLNYPRTRQLAKDLGVSEYFTGMPCKRGHISIRKTKGTCVSCLREGDKKETVPTKMSEKDQVEFYKTARKNLINDMETLIKPFGWKMEGVSVRTPQYIDSGIECFLKPIKKNKPIDCYDLVKNIELLIRQPNFPFPWIDGDSPDNRGFWIQISTTD